MKTTEKIATSNDMTWAGEDIHVGVALNLIFAIADVLEEANSCEINLSETLAADLDNADPFETAYVYGESHIRLSLIPELENLIRLAGDATLTGEIDPDGDGPEEAGPVTVRLQETLDNWKRQLELNDELTAEGLENEFVENRSFSGGTEYSYAESVDTTRVTSLESTRIYIDSQNTLGAIFSVGYDQVVALGFDIRSEWKRDATSNEGTSESIGYVLSDGDTGDYFSVNIGKNPRYRTTVFETVSGRSSNPCEGNTQCRDNPIIFVDPPVLNDVDPEGAGNFQLTLINGSESNERRQYTMAVPGETNRQNLGVTVTGDLLGGQRLETFLLDPGKAITINMDVLRVSPPFAYRDVGVMLYPQVEYDIWHADPRQDFALSDTAFFSVFFDSTGGQVQTAILAQGWNWLSINREGGDIDSVFKRVRLDHGDLIRDQKRASRYDSTRGWVGDISTVEPGVGYRLKVQNPGYFRLTGEPVASTEPVDLTSGWNWIGYLPTKSTHIAEALESLGKKVMEGDAVVGQDGFAQYVNRAGWVGTLREMSPGKSYALYSSNGGQLLYPLEPTNEGAPAVPPRETTVRGPEWEVVPGDYTTSMTVVAEIRNGSLPVEQTTTKIAVFAEDQIRGTGEVHFIEGLGKHLAFIQIYGEFDEEQEMVVHVFDGELDKLYEEVATVSYTAQQMLGQPARPVVLDLAKAGSAPQLVDLPEEFALYPNYPNP
ncbi:MAG: hypothetical protein KJO98_02295, partial [Rhodothermia bacterium]|nr:hypothetical protein [Rhodothermia bacterium]